MYSSFNARDRVSHGYRTVNESGINVFVPFLDSTQSDRKYSPKLMLI
jgi:hypothetical protein